MVRDSFGGGVGSSLGGELLLVAAQVGGAVGRTADGAVG